MSGIRVKDQILAQRALQILLSLWKLQGFQELCARGRDQYIYSKDTGTLLESHSVINNWTSPSSYGMKNNFQLRPLGFAGFQLILSGSKCRYGLGKHMVSLFQSSGVTELRDIIDYSEPF